MRPDGKTSYIPPDNVVAHGNPFVRRVLRQSFTIKVVKLQHKYEHVFCITHPACIARFKKSFQSELWLNKEKSKWIEIEILILCTPDYVLQGDTSMAMDTDSNPDEEGAEESHDGPVRPSPSPTHEDASLQCAPIRAVSAPCSPSAPQPSSGPICSSVSAPDCAATQKAGERPNSLPPSSPRALTHNEWAYDSAVCPVEPQHPGMQRDKGIHTARDGIMCAAGVVGHNIVLHVSLC